MAAKDAKADAKAKPAANEAEKKSSGSKCGCGSKKK